MVVVVLHIISQQALVVGLSDGSPIYSSPCVLQYIESKIKYQNNSNLIMCFDDDFKKDIQDQISQFLQDTKETYVLQSADSSSITDHLHDFNLGYGMGFVEASLLMRFTQRYQRSMKAREKAELKILMYKFCLELKSEIINCMS